MIRSLSVVVPAYNEAKRLPTTLLRLRSFLERRLEELEIIVVDDGSQDDTAAIATEGGHANVMLRQHHRRRGKGAAVRTGVLAASCEWVLVTDADLAVPIEELEALQPAARAAPIVIGSKRPSQHRPLSRRITGSVGQVLVRLLLVRGFHDTQCGFKLFRREVAQRLFAIQRIDGFGYDFEVLYLARRYNLGIQEVPVQCLDAGGGSVRWSSYTQTFLELLRIVRWRFQGRYPDAL